MNLVAHRLKWIYEACGKNIHASNRRVFTVEQFVYNKTEKTECKWIEHYKHLH